MSVGASVGASVDDGLVGALAAVGAAAVDVDVDAGFFHRTLARWLGLPEGRIPGGGDVLVEWDYRFWKAELSADGLDEAAVLAGGAVRRERWSAVLYRLVDDVPLRVAWTVDKNARGGIVGSAWLTAPPRLVADRAARADRADDRPPTDSLDDATVARLVDADGA